MDRAREEAERPFVGDPEQAEEEIDDLEDGDRFHGTVKVLCEEVPKDLGPEEAF